MLSCSGRFRPVLKAPAGFSRGISATDGFGLRNELEPIKWIRRTASVWLGVVVFESIVLRDAQIPELLVVVRLGSNTILDEHLLRSTEECHARWGIWGFSVLEVPNGDYGALVRLRPIVATRRRLFVASGADLVDAGYPLLPTLDSPRWTVTVSAPTPQHFAGARRVFDGPIENPAWSRGSRSVR